MPPHEVNPRVSVLIVDDEEMIRDLVRAVLEYAGITVLGEAEDGLVALDRYRSLDPPTAPRVVLLDNRMPGRTGLSVAAEILEAYPTQIVVLFSAHLDDATVSAAEGLGVAACVSKKDVSSLPGILDGLLKSA
ncbi:response regulator transcription factor [Nocardioides sp.]|uniref:response regulator transcription factor n=1 Tax=Nocardioides sp. TaxID=35761 RepID=UPI003561CF87